MSFVNALADQSTNQFERCARLPNKEAAMPFVNEVISKEDQNKVGALYIEQLYGRYGHAYDWTVDRVRDIYLLEGSRDKDDPEKVPFLFGWHGQHINFVAVGHDERAPGGGFDWRWTLASHFTTGVFARRTPAVLPPEALADLKDALTAHCGAVWPVQSISFDF
jgi:hypothetical protein